MFFCLAVNMLEADDLRAVLEQAEVDGDRPSLREKADDMEKRLRACAEKKGIPLELRPW